MFDFTNTCFLIYRLFRNVVYLFFCVCILLRLRDGDYMAWHWCEGGEALQAPSTPPPSTAAHSRLLTVTATDWNSAAVLYSKRGCAGLSNT